MIIESTMTQKDYVRLSIALMLKAWTTRVFFALLFVGLVFGIISIVLADNFLILVIWLIFFISFVGYYWFVINRYINSKENSKLFLPKRFEFTDDIVLVKTSFGKEELNWNVFVKWRYLAGQYVLNVTSHTFLVIKDTDVKDNEEFISMLDRKVKKP
jgi:hypothetical protein